MSEETFRWVIAGGVGIAAFALLMAGTAVVAIAVMMGKLKAKMEPILESAAPMAQTAKETMADLKPRIAQMSGHAAEISGHAVEVSQLVVTEAQRYSELSKDVAGRAKVQVAKIDAVVDETIGGAQEMGTAARRAVIRPLRLVEGVAAGIRRAVATYSRRNQSDVSDATQDEEMFI